MAGATVRIGEPDAALLRYAWQHRFKLSPYDAPYLALADRHGVAVVTNDLRLARAAEASGVPVEVPSLSGED